MLENNNNKKKSIKLQVIKSQSRSRWFTFISKFNWLLDMVRLRAIYIQNSYTFLLSYEHTLRIVFAFFQAEILNLSAYSSYKQKQNKEYSIVQHESSCLIKMDLSMTQALNPTQVNSIENTELVKP